MNFVYCGNFNTANRNPLALFKAIKFLADHKYNVLFRVVGDFHPQHKNMVYNMNIQEHVRFIGKVPHSIAVEEMIAADVLVVTQEPNSSSITPIASKTYEYLRAGRAILAILPEGDNAKTISCYASRYEMVKPNDFVGITRSMLKFYEEWQNGNLESFLYPLNCYMDKFNRNFLTSKLANIFNQLVEHQ